MKTLNSIFNFRSNANNFSSFETDALTNAQLNKVRGGGDLDPKNPWEEEEGVGG